MINKNQSAFDAGTVGADFVTANTVNGACADVDADFVVDVDDTFNCGFTDDEICMFQDCLLPWSILD